MFRNLVVVNLMLFSMGIKALADDHSGAKKGRPVADTVSRKGINATLEDAEGRINADLFVFRQHHGQEYSEEWDILDHHIALIEKASGKDQEKLIIDLKSYLSVFRESLRRAHHGFSQACEAGLYNGDTKKLIKSVCKKAGLE